MAGKWVVVVVAGRGAPRGEREEGQRCESPAHTPQFHVPAPAQSQMGWTYEDEDNTLPSLKRPRVEPAPVPEPPPVLGYLGRAIHTAALKLGYEFPKEEPVEERVALFKANGTNLDQAGPWADALSPEEARRIKKMCTYFSNFKRLGRGIIPECEYMARRFPLLAEEIRSFVNDPPEEQLKKIQKLTGKKTDYWMKLEAPGIYAKILANRAMKKGEKPVTDLAEDPGIMAPLVEEKLATEEGRELLDALSEPGVAGGKRKMHFFLAERPCKRHGKGPSRWEYQG